MVSLITHFQRFNTQPPEGGCIAGQLGGFVESVSTHSHPKVAATINKRRDIKIIVSTHSHPKVAAW